MESIREWSIEFIREYSLIFKESMWIPNQFVGHMIEVWNPYSLAEKHHSRPSINWLIKLKLKLRLIYFQIIV